MKKIFKFIISIAIPLIIGFLGSFFTSGSVNSWYTTINKPSFNPPNWIFGPVWTILFIMIGLSFYLVWIKDFGKQGRKQNEKQKKRIIGVYCVQLALNFLWSVFFFGLRNPLLSFMEIIILWFFIITNIILFYRVSEKAGYLLIPYLLWVSFAAILNFAIVILN